MQERAWERETPDDTPSALALWRVHALLLDSAHASALLPGLPHTAGATAATRRGAANPQAADPPDMPLGADLRFWAAAAKFTLGLLARQRYLPGAREVTRGVGEDYTYGFTPQVTGEWRLALVDANEHERFERLASAMPESARCAYSPLAQSDSGAVVSRETLLEDFCNVTTNALLSAWMRRLNIGLQMAQQPPDHPSSHYGRSYDFYDMYGSLTARWLRSLANPGPGIYLSAADARTLLDGIERWHARATAERNVPFRLCLRLSAPEELEGDETAEAPEDVAQQTERRANISMLAGEIGAVPASHPAAASDFAG
jgi:hypothetical protein